MFADRSLCRSLETSLSGKKLSELKKLVLRLGVKTILKAKVTYVVTYIVTSVVTSLEKRSLSGRRINTGERGV